MKPTSKRTQRDYTLAFKLAVVDQVVKGELTYKQLKINMAYKAALLFWFGFISMVG